MSELTCGFRCLRCLHLAVHYGQADADAAGDLAQRLALGMAGQDRAAFVVVDHARAAAFAASARGGVEAVAGLVEQTLFTNIECWERDEGGIWEELKGALGDMAEHCVDAAVDIMEHGEKEDASLAALIGVVAALLAALLEWLTNDDDLVGELSLAFNRNALAALASRPGHEGYWNFASNGHYRLYIRANDTPARRKLRYRALSNGSWSP
ncbi:hypothetical protein ABZV58_18320 [Nocardia sp. NPDC004654]|uniref:hypothetical protein n=1 Tax=Nocardia sp. NPDC004654 TaxID=3154776 RepID=UPI0033A8CB7E